MKKKLSRQPDRRLVVKKAKHQGTGTKFTDIGQFLV
jgi:hypothetical protein